MTQDEAAGSKYVSRPSDDWEAHWEAFGDASFENPANKYRLKLVIELLELRPGRQRILDIGSGQGGLSLAVASQRPDLEVRGLEYSFSGVARAQAAAAAQGMTAHFEQRDLMAGEALPQDRAWGDTGICSEVLEHLDDPATFLRNAITYIRPGGRLVVTVPSGPRSAFDRHIGHRRHYDPQTLHELLALVGLQDIQIARAGFPFFNLYRLAVIARGRSLISDIDTEFTGRAASMRASAIRVASKAFARTFDFNLDRSPFGWQLVATAQVPE